MKALIFDMDGTLWDGVQTYTDAWNAILLEKKVGKPLTKAFLDSLMGMEEDAFLKAVLPALSVEQRREIYAEVVEKQYAMIRTQGGLIYPGVQEGLEALKERYALFIVSNCPKYTVKHFMAFAGIEDLITDHRTHGQKGWSKAKNIKSLIEQYELDRAYYIGDTQGDGQASAQAGLPFVYVRYGFGSATNSDFSFDSFPELVKHFIS